MKAFPSPHDPKTGTMQLGMELRDYFAAKALQAIVANKELVAELENNAAIARSSYNIADSMLKARQE